MAKRAPQTPPDIAGFTPVELIGAGGYADVFLYAQENPRQNVAIKVLIPEALINDSAANLFREEANLMARVRHPFIVQVFRSGISGDGRPFLIMEYYPGANYYDRARSEQMAVPEVLRTGIQVASAVETAHVAGIFHRDIKPANILTSEYNRPGLTDFGIAATMGPGEEAADGVSIPWAPPEALADNLPDRRSDVYSLAATVYTLLVGRSPFEIPGGDNSELSLMARVENAPVPNIHRDDVPASLERVLVNAMAKAPDHRPTSAAEFGRQLQAIEAELKLTVTPLELANSGRVVRSRSDGAVDDDATRIKGVTEVQAQRPELIRQVGSGQMGTPIEPRRREGLLAAPAVADTVGRPSKPAEPEPVAYERGVKKGYLIAAGVALLFVVGAFASTLFGGASDTTDTTEVLQVNDNFDEPAVAAPLPVSVMSGIENDSGTFTFEWERPAPGLDFLVTPDGGTAERVTETTYTSTTRCIEISSVSTTGVISAPAKECAP